MFGFLSSSTLREKTIHLVDVFARDIAAPSKVRGKGALETAADGAMQTLFRGVADFCREQRLGVIGRARLARTLQDELRRSGFPGEMVSKVTSAVSVNVLAAPGRKNKAGS